MAAIQGPDRTSAGDYPRILGIDPGLHITGYAVIEVTPSRPVLCEAGVVRGDGSSLPARLKALYDGIAEVIAQFRPQAMVVEQLFAHYRHPRTAIIMGHARGTVMLA